MCAATLGHTHSLQHHRAEAQAAAKKLLQLEKERDKYSIEAGEANARYLQVCTSGWATGVQAAATAYHSVLQSPSKALSSTMQVAPSCIADGAEPALACN